MEEINGHEYEMQIDLSRRSNKETKILQTTKRRRNPFQCG